MIVDYTVVHKVVGTDQVLATEKLTGPVDEQTLASALTTDDSRRQGYDYVDAAYKNILLSLDPTTNTVTFWYSTEAMHHYIVHYVDRATGLSLAKDLSFTSQEILIKKDALTIAGYSAEASYGWVTDADPDLTLYYDVIKHTVTFNANGGTGAPDAETVKDGAAASDPSTVPTRSGYTFEGWYLSDGTLYDFSTPVTADVVLYAKWTPVQQPVNPTTPTTNTTTTVVQQVSVEETVTPATGDSNLGLLAAGGLLCVAGGALLLVASAHRRRQQ